MSKLSGLEKLKKMSEEYKVAVREQGEKVLTEFIKGFLAETPEITALRWRQYTPHFNDGDACEFGVGELYFRLTNTEEDNEDGDYGDGFLGSYDLEDTKLSKAVQKRIDAFGSAFSEIPNEVFLALGDHSMITATAKSLEVEEYSHD